MHYDLLSGYLGNFPLANFIFPLSSAIKPQMFYFLHLLFLLVFLKDLLKNCCLVGTPLFGYNESGGKGGVTMRYYDADSELARKSLSHYP
jgi:hypothetical protein